MLTVGHIARLFGITTKTLRYYDSIGLFAPSRIGEGNHYRLYSSNQFPELRRILFLRSMGLGIEVILDLKRDGTMDDDDKILRLLQECENDVQAEIVSRQKQIAEIQRMVDYITLTGGIPMEPKIVEKEAFTVVGMAWNSKSSEGDIPGMWQRFIAREHEVGGKLQPAVSYGICEPSNNEEDFTYVAGFETKGESVPQGMKMSVIPAQRYAVFTHKGNIEKLSETYDLIYSKWLPLQGLE